MRKVKQDPDTMIISLIASSFAYSAILSTEKITVKPNTMSEYNMLIVLKISPCK